MNIDAHYVTSDSGSGGGYLGEEGDQGEEAGEVREFAGIDIKQRTIVKM